jgi:hypothetical protein
VEATGGLLGEPEVGAGPLVIAILFLPERYSLGAEPGSEGITNKGLICCAEKIIQIFYS